MRRPIQRAKPRANDHLRQATAGDVQRLSRQVSAMPGHAGRHPATRRTRLTTEKPQVRTLLRPRTLSCWRMYFVLACEYVATFVWASGHPGRRLGLGRSRTTIAYSTTCPRGSPGLRRRAAASVTVAGHIGWTQTLGPVAPGCVDAVVPVGSLGWSKIDPAGGDDGELSFWSPVAGRRHAVCAGVT